MGRKSNSREVMQWENEEDEVEEAAEKLRNKHAMLERNKDREREPVQDKKGRALRRSVYTDAQEARTLE